MERRSIARRALSALLTARTDFARLFLACLFVAGVWVTLPAQSLADTVTVKGSIATAEDLNPDYRSRPSPVNLILFQLTSAEAFNNADFFSLYDPDSDILGGDLIARSQRMLQPGQAMEFEEEFDEEARFIGIVAAFRDIEQAQWRGIIELPEKGFFKSFMRKSKMTIELQSLAVMATME